MEKQSRSFGWGRNLLTTLVALVAVLGAGGFHAARAADAPTLELVFESRLCPSPPPLLGLDWFNGCGLSTSAVPVIRVAGSLGPNRTFPLPITTSAALSGQEPGHYVRFDLTPDPRTITIRYVGHAALRLRAVMCWWNDGKAWVASPFRLPQQSQTATLDWSVPASHGAAPIAGLNCILLFTTQPQPSL
jgi:hypothetical protein